jgi:hypothetical protein
MDPIDEGVKWGLLLMLWIGLLVAGGAVVEMMLHWRDRGWIRRLRNIEDGRERQRIGQ